MKLETNVISPERLQTLIWKSGYGFTHDQMTACVFGFLEPVLIVACRREYSGCWIIFRIAEESVQ